MLAALGRCLRDSHAAEFRVADMVHDLLLLDGPRDATAAKLARMLAIDVLRDALAE